MVPRMAFTNSASSSSLTPVSTRRCIRSLYAACACHSHAQRYSVGKTGPPRVLCRGRTPLRVDPPDVRSYLCQIAAHTGEERAHGISITCGHDIAQARQRLQYVDEVDGFAPDMVLNAATVKYTVDAFRQVLPHVRAATISRKPDNASSMLSSCPTESGLNNISLSR